MREGKGSLMKQLIFLPLLFGILASCASSIHQYNAGDYSDYKRLKQKGKFVSVTEEKQYIIGKFDNSFVDSAYEKLKAKCKGKKITGVSSNYMTHLGFFSFKEKLIFTGYCI